MGVGSLLASWWGFALIIWLFYLIVTHLPQKKYVVTEWKGLPPSSVDPYEDMRAWDQHLISMGMLPIYFPQEAGPIIKTTRIKDGDILGSYWDGEVLRTSPVPERVGATAERVSNEIQDAQTLQREMFSYESSGPYEDIEDLRCGETIDDQGVRHLFF